MYRYTKNLRECAYMINLLTINYTFKTLLICSDGPERTEEIGRQEDRQKDRWVDRQIGGAARFLTTSRVFERWNRSAAGNMMTEKACRLQAGGFQKRMVQFMENPMKTDDDWGDPYFRKPPYRLMSSVIFQLFMIPCVKKLDDGKVFTGKLNI